MSGAVTRPSVLAEVVGGDGAEAAAHAVKFLAATTQLSRFDLNAKFLVSH